MNTVSGTFSLTDFLSELARRALLEDQAGHDVTTMALLKADHPAAACIRTREPVVVSGVDMAMAVFQAADAGLQIHACASEGDRLPAGEGVLTIEGRGPAILSAERTALNFLQHLCGIATLARAAVKAVAGNPVQLLATRKTIPGMRRLERRAAEAGGFAPHRTSLADGILIKDNHIALSGSAEQAVAIARQQAPAHLLIEVEIDDPAQLEPVISAGAQIVLLDNFTPRQVAQTVTSARQRVLLEASGGITMKTLPLFAATGVDRISVGFVTHSAPAADLSLDLQPVELHHDD